jgi:hypothetical protein
MQPPPMPPQGMQPPPMLPQGMQPPPAPLPLQTALTPAGALSMVNTPVNPNMWENYLRRNYAQGGLVEAPRGIMTLLKRGNL